MPQKGGREGGRVRFPFKKIIRTNRKPMPGGGVRGGTAPFKKIIRTNRSLCPEGGGGEGKANNGVGSVGLR